MVSKTIQNLPQSFILSKVIDHRLPHIRAHIRTVENFFPTRSRHIIAPLVSAACPSSIMLGEQFENTFISRHSFQPEPGGLARSVPIDKPKS